MQETEETRDQPLGRDDPQKEGTATQASILPWQIPWTEEPTVHGVTKNRTPLKRLSMHTPMCRARKIIGEHGA